MVDTGASVNIIKLENIKGETLIDESDVIDLKGITEQPVTTMGVVIIEILGHDTPFHVVRNNFPIDCEGILGSEFLKDNEATIDYKNNHIKWKGNKINFHKESMVISARTISTFYINI
ncbi:hypothetical protein DD595_25680, partial [Enterobacter cloacae complex sp. 4DZ3-17B2]